MTGAYFDDPNRQAVCLEPAWAEGSGGSDTSAGGGPPDGDGGLDAMTKDELVEEAGRRGVDTKADWTKAEIREAIEAS